jgi:hypothetical protein
LGLISAIQSTIRNNATFVGTGFDVSKGSPKGAVAANPAFRSAVISVTVGVPYDYSDYPSDVKASFDIPNVLLPPYERLTPGGGAYGNEGASRQVNFQQVFYGEYYDRLQQIKAKYDPNGVFYGLTGVGSEKWTQRADGRLCKA